MGGKVTPEYQRAYRARNAERLREQKRAYYARRREHFIEKFAEYRAANREKLRAYDRLRRIEDPDKKRELDKAYRAKNREALNAKRAPYFAARKSEKRKYDIAYREASAEHLKEKKLRYYAENKPAFCARVVKRNAQKRKAMPSWANEFFIDEAYRLADLRSKITGFKWHVDHIVPLQSKRVCGFHVEHNLRVIPAVANLAKGNRHWPDMP